MRSRLDYLLNQKFNRRPRKLRQDDYTGASNSTVDYLANLGLWKEDYWTAGVPSRGRAGNKSVSTVHRKPELPTLDVVSQCLP